MTDQTLFRADGLVKSFRVGGAIFGRRFDAVREVSLQVAPGETLSIVGESGCGKSTLARMLVGLETPDAGAVLFRGHDMRAGGSGARARRRQVQMVFQDPYASLNPRRTVLDIIAEPLDVHGLARGAARRARVEDLLRLVDLDPAASSRFPHEFSGGQRQRIGIARALAADPAVLVCDEAVSALDVSVQAQVVNLLIGLQKRLGLAIVFIAHDLAVVRALSHRVMVMYLGRVVEYGTVEEVLDRPRHPYTQILRASVLEPDPALMRPGRAATTQGEPPSITEVLPGCRFRPRCPRATGICARVDPALAPSDEGSAAACHHAGAAEPVAA